MPWFKFYIAEWRAVFETIAVCSAALCLLAVWAALSRRHWFFRASVMVVGLLSLIPIRAYEPLLLFLFVLPLSWAVIALLRRWLDRSVGSDWATQEQRSTDHPKPRLRVRTLIVVGVVLFGLATVAIEQVPFSSWYDRWLLRTLAASCIIALIYEFGIRSRLEPRAVDASNVENKASGWRFGMFDLLLATVVAAAVSTMLATVFSQRLLLDWVGMLVSGLCMVLLTVVCCSAVLLRKRRIFVLVALPAVIGGVAAVHTWVLPDWIMFQHVIWSDDPGEIFGLLFIGEWLFSLLLFAAICFLHMAGCFDMASPKHITRPSSARFGLVAFIGMCLVIYGPLTVVYWQMLDETPVLEYELPPTNSYPELLAAVNELTKLNPTESSLAEIRVMGGSPAQCKHLKSVYQDLMTALEKPSYVPLDLKQNSPDEWAQGFLPAMQRTRSVSRILNRESDQAVVGKVYDEAAAYGIANMQLGSKQQVGGLVVHSLVGIAIEGVAFAQLSKVRCDISADQTRRLVRDLEAIEHAREPIEVTVQRDDTWSDRSYSWRYRLSKMAVRVLTSNDNFKQYDVAPEKLAVVRAYAGAAKRRDVQFRLLRTDLAIRLFQHDEGRLPEKLDELVGRYVSSVPIDPFCDRPLIYRRVEDGFVLYSVWKDGVDNGGTFGSWTDVYGNHAGFDFDLDVASRPRTPATAPKTTTGQ